MNTLFKKETYLLKKGAGLIARKGMSSGTVFGSGLVPDVHFLIEFGATNDAFHRALFEFLNSLHRDVCK